MIKSIKLIIITFACLLSSAYSQDIDRGKFILENTTENKIDFKYLDEFGILATLSLNPHQKTVVSTVLPTLLYINSPDNETFLISGEDGYKLSLGRGKNYELTSSSNIHSRELFIIKKIVDSGNTFMNDRLDQFLTKNNFSDKELSDIPLLKKHYALHSKQRTLLKYPLVRDSMLFQGYLQELSLFAELNLSQPVSKSFEKTAKSYFFYKYLKEKSAHLNIRSFNENKMPANYKDTLVHLKQYLDCDECISLDVYKGFASNYVAYLKRTNIDVYGLILKEFKGETKDFMLFTLLLGYSNLQPDSLKIYYQRFLSDCNNNAYKDFIINANQYIKLKFEQSVKEMLSADEVRFSLTDILEKHKGKVIYLDFWASWCSPCLDEIPSSLELSNKYRDVVFLYISLDKNMNAWHTAMASMNLPQQRNYLLLNDFKSELATKFKIATIPRYMVFGKDGKPISLDSPRPSDNKLVKMFSEH